MTMAKGTITSICPHRDDGRGVGIAADNRGEERPLGGLTRALRGLLRRGTGRGRPLDRLSLEERVRSFLGEHPSRHYRAYSACVCPVATRTKY
jgi:hypothetical protein